MGRLSEKILPSTSGQARRIAAASRPPPAWRRRRAPPPTRALGAGRDGRPIDRWLVVVTRREGRDRRPRGGHLDGGGILSGGRRGGLVEGWLGRRRRWCGRRRHGRRCFGWRQRGGLGRRPLIRRGARRALVTEGTPSTSRRRSRRSRRAAYPLSPEAPGSRMRAQISSSCSRGAVAPVISVRPALTMSAARDSAPGAEAPPAARASARAGPPARRAGPTRRRRARRRRR